MLKLTQVNEWGLILHSLADGTRPVPAMGASVTPGNNAYGSYVSLLSGATLTDDCYRIDICINTVGVSAAARDCVVSLGLDPAGGTSFTSIADLVCGPASNYRNAAGFQDGGTWFRFPLFISNGTSIGVAAAVNSATATAINVFCRAFCRPTRPDIIYTGSYLDQFGVTLASSSGAAITPGTTSEGAWTQVGSALARPLRWLEFGYGLNNATINEGALDVDVGIGDVSNQRVVIPNAQVRTGANETVSKNVAGEYVTAATGDIIYARSQSAAALETGHSIAVYGVGG